MSVTPTKEALIVALDFEGMSGALVKRALSNRMLTGPGVHSIERSAQEDTLLVLFNTAISNLVYFTFNYCRDKVTHFLLLRFSSATILP